MADLIKGCEHHTITKDGVVVNTKTGNIKTHMLTHVGYYYVNIHENKKGKAIALHRLLAIQYLPNPENKRTVNHIDGNKLNNKLSNLEWATDSENVQHAYDIGLQPYRRKLTIKDYEEILLNRFLMGETITDISKTCGQGLTQLSYHLREASKNLDIENKYEVELIRQKAVRAKSTGASNRHKICLQMLDKTTKKVLKTFNNITEAKEYLGVKSAGTIHNAYSGKQNTAYGYLWVKSVPQRPSPDGEYTQASGNV